MSLCWCLATGMCPMLFCLHSTCLHFIPLVPHFISSGKMLQNRRCGGAGCLSGLSYQKTIYTTGLSQTEQEVDFYPVKTGDLCYRKSKYIMLFDEHFSSYSVKETLRNCKVQGQLFHFDREKRKIRISERLTYSTQTVSWVIISTVAHLRCNTIAAPPLAKIFGGQHYLKQAGTHSCWLWCEGSIL